MSKADRGCGCGGASAWPSAFVRPRFFAGQLLTEDDLELLVGYVSGKHRLYNRTFSGPGVVCGFEVGCDPCGGGHVLVRPGHALDCCGNDIVLPCKEKVDVAALVRELRISSVGVDCGEPCDEDGPRRYGLYVRYEETPADPVAPYDTEEPCPTPGCTPSRIREGLRFVVKHDGTDDHRYNPGTRLLASVGDERRFGHIQRVGQRLGLYLDSLHTAWRGAGRTIQFDAADAERFDRSLQWLRDSGEGPLSPSVAVTMTEEVRALASAIARYDTHDQSGQERLRSEHKVLGEVDAARRVLGAACERLAQVDPEQVWPDPLRRGLAAAVVAETRARVVPESPDPAASVERLLLAHGTPMDNVLQVDFRSDLGELREWLLARMERAPGLSDCSLRGDLRRISLPPLLPRPEPDGTQRVSDVDLAVLAEATRDMTLVLHRFVRDAACSTLNPPCTDCTDTDVLLAYVELDGCDVVRICSATREQVLPGGSMYGEWLPKLYRLRELADRLCCEPVPAPAPPALPAKGPVQRPYVPGLFEEWPRTGDLEQMLSLLLTPAPGETAPKALHEQTYRVPTEVTDSLHELNVLRTRVGDLTATVEALRAQLDTAREQVSQVREELPERLGDRLEELENTPRAEEEPPPAKPPARRTRSSSRAKDDGPSGGARKPRSGDSS